LQVLTEYSKQKAIEKKDNYAVNAMLRSYKALFNHAIDYIEIRINNPCKNIKFFKTDKKLKSIPSEQEIDIVLEKCLPHQKDLILFVMQTGCRISEALRFTSDDIFDNYIVLFTRKSKNSDLMPRKLPKPQVLKGKTYNGRVFHQWTEQPRFLEDIIKREKLKKWSWHNLRHRYASKLSQEGKPIFEIMSLLGHTSLNTTIRYLQMITD
jgi:integrase